MNRSNVLMKQRTMNHNKASAGGRGNYRSAVRGYVRGLWTGTYDLFGFMDGMGFAISRAFAMAWYEGAESCGIKPSELTPNEQAQLQIEVHSETSFLTGFGSDIMRASKKNGGKLGPHLQRAEMWVNRYDGIYSQAMMMACGDQKIKWILNPAKENCPDCLRLNNRVYRASTWKKYDIRPKMRSLACGGYACGCIFVKTEDPCTPGRPPTIGV